MLAEIRVGSIIGADGSVQPGRADRSGALVATDAHGRYAEAARLGNLFSASNVAAQAVSVALTATYTGLCISNPLGNTKNAVLLGAMFALTVAPAAIASLHLIAGYSAVANVTHTTPLASPGIQNNLIGTGPASTMKADSAATIVNPNYLIPWFPVSRQRPFHPRALHGSTSRASSSFHRVPGLLLVLLPP